MPMSRSRGLTRRPRSGSETTRSPIEMRPPVGCSRPATQRNVVVLPQPEGPSNTTISPAGTAKLTPSMAGRPIANCLRRSDTSSVAVMPLSISSKRRSLAISERLVPLRHPCLVQLDVFLELREPDLDHLRVKTLGVDRRHLERGQVAEFLDH